MAIGDLIIGSILFIALLAAAAQAATAYYYYSEPGDYIGAGQSKMWFMESTVS